MQRRDFMMLAGAGMTAAYVRPAAAGLPASVSLVVPFSAGGGADQLARAFIEAAGLTGSTVIVDNRPGANGTIATRYVMQQPPTGGTLLLGSSSTQALGPLMPGGSGDPLGEVEIISILAETANALVVPAASPWRTLDDYTAAAKRSALSYASFGIGSSGHLYGLVLASARDVELTHIPYRGSSQAVADLIGGHVDSAFLTTTAVEALVRSGRLRVLAVTGPRRTGLLPDVATFAEQGVAGLDFNGWFALFGPKGIAPVAVTQLSQSIAALRNNSHFQGLMRQQGYDWIGSTPAEAAVQWRDTVEIFRRILAAHPVEP
jgi:tripartite-type tricarboxylate transporter receptor subunit TctC